MAGNMLEMRYSVAARRRISKMAQSCFTSVPLGMGLWWTCWLESQLYVIMAELDGRKFLRPAKLEEGSP